MSVEIIWVVFAIFLYTLCAALLVFEIFIPSFGLLTLLAIAAFAWATGLFFQMGSTVGWCGLASSAVIIPVFWVLTYKIFPNTSVGRTMILKSSPRELGDALPERERLLPLKGKCGTAISPLRPVGVCQIDGLRVVCSAETGFIARNAPIEVVGVQGHTVTVRMIQQT